MSCSRSPLADRTNQPNAPTPTPARTSATARTVSSNGNNRQATGSSAASAAPAAPTTPASPPPPHRVHFALPGHDHAFQAPHLREELPAIPWAPSPDELRTATVGVRNAQHIMRCAEASTTLWVSEYIAELSDRFRMRGRTGFTPIVPEENVDSDARLDQYTRAIDGCNNIVHGIKRTLRQYAATFDREVEFGAAQDTTHRLLSQYVYHGEHDGHVKRRRHSPAMVPTETDPIDATVTPDSTGATSVAKEADPVVVDTAPVTTVVLHTSASNASPIRPRLRRTESSVQDDTPPTTDPVDPSYDRCKRCKSWRELHTVADCPNQGMMSPRP